MYINKEQRWGPPTRSAAGAARLYNRTEGLRQGRAVAGARIYVCMDGRTDVCMYVCMHVCTFEKEMRISANLPRVRLLEEILTGARIRDKTLRHVPPLPLFNVVFLSPVCRCRMPVIQLLCLGENFFLPMLNGEHEGQDSKCVWWCRTFHQPCVRLAWTDLCWPYVRLR